VLQFLAQWTEPSSDALKIAGLIAAFVVAACAFIPRAPLCLISGAVLGVYGFPLAALASTGGAVLAFLGARYLFRTRFLKIVESRHLVMATVEAFESEGWWLLALFRLGSPLPGTLTNYVLGLTRVGVVSFSFATLIGVLPQTLIFVYFGAIGKMAIDEKRGALNISLHVIGVLLIAIVIIVMTTKVTKLIQDRQCSLTDRIAEKSNANSRFD
jgi:uncharacterized membrane protein YdjX (TVP38/TMEM64 family)